MVQNREKTQKEKALRKVLIGDMGPIVLHIFCESICFLKKENAEGVCGAYAVKKRERRRIIARHIPWRPKDMPFEKINAEGIIIRRANAYAFIKK